MSVLVLSLIVLATVLVMLSGVWVAIALIAAIWRVDRPGPSPSVDTPDKNPE